MFVPSASQKWRWSWVACGSLDPPYCSQRQEKHFLFFFFLGTCPDHRDLSKIIKNGLQWDWLCTCGCIPSVRTNMQISSFSPCSLTQSSSIKDKWNFVTPDCPIGVRGKLQQWGPRWRRYWVPWLFPSTLLPESPVQLSSGATHIFSSYFCCSWNLSCFSSFLSFRFSSPKKHLIWKHLHEICSITVRK